MTLKSRLSTLERHRREGAFSHLSDDELTVELATTCESLSAAGGAIAPDWRRLIEAGEFDRLGASLC